MTRIYLDYAATTPTDPRVVDAMQPYWTEKFGNPSSIHSYGQETKDATEQARQNVATLLNAEPDEIIFTGSGTESDNTAIKSIGFALKEKGNHIITTAVEHHAILHACDFLETQGFKVTQLPIDGDGLISMDDLENAISESTILISIMHANNEVGTIQPIEQIGALAKKHSILFHTDAVQTVGHEHIDVRRMNIHLLSLSAHKFNGPKGIGALYLRKDTPFIPFMDGGAQELGRRSSTHNVTGIVGLGKAAELAMAEMDEEGKRIQTLRDQLIDRLIEIPGSRLNGHRTKRLANNVNVSFGDIEGESLLMNLDLEGIAASSGSACSSGSTDPSHVLLAMGLTTDEARGSLRISLGRFTTQEEIDRTGEVVNDVVKHLRSLAPGGGFA